ncbi:MAG: hypothetical protein P9L92_13205 [Candidatus Electryonea clarkiae]|nr:hypothetical protein [Candidatus Electryonea clarkiae]MDP8289228.1 hypothetical protein [Candidatus Electryonea clarkiae]
MKMLSYHNKAGAFLRFRTIVIIASFLILGFLHELPEATFANPPMPYWGTTTGLMQGERIARVTTLMNDILKAETDTTSWLAFGTHLNAYPQEKEYAPTRFTLFFYADTTDVPNAAGPSVTLKAQIALDDTSGKVYEQRDGSLDLVPDTDPVTTIAGQVLPVPVYGGGWIRFIVTSTDSAKVKLDLWRIR